MFQHDSRYATSWGLLSELKAGDDQGWQRFVFLYTPLIFTWCRKAGLRPADAADVSQDVLRNVASGIGGFRYDRPDDNFRGWLWTITRRAISKHVQRAEKQVVAQGGSHASLRIAEIPDWVDDEHVPEEPTGEAELIRRVADLIRGDFSDSTWEAFWLSMVENLPASEIAERLNMTANGVRQAKFRVIARFREFIGGG